MTEITRISSELLRDGEVAAALRVSVACIRRWRLAGIGPKFVKVGRSVRYRAADLERWLAERPSGGEHVAGGRCE
jgi:predicted DNA-binding transcriptional regulator AlpA